MKDTIIKCSKSTLETSANKTSLLLGEYLEGDANGKKNKGLPKSESKIMKSKNIGEKMSQR